MKWQTFVTANLKYIIRPNTDVSHVRMEKKPRTCPCGCKRKFFVAEGSDQRFASESCRAAYGERRDQSSKEKMKAAFQKLDHASYYEGVAKRRGRAS